MSKLTQRRRGNTPLLNRIISVLLVLLTLAHAFPPVLAHNEDAVLRLANSLAGPFTLSVWTYPALLRAGTIHFSVLALEATTGQPVVNPTVLIEAVAGDTHTHSAPITGHTYLDPISRYQEADLALLTPGQYEITVQVTGKDGQQGQTTFDLEIVSATGFKWLIILLMGQAGLFALWLAKEGIKTWGIDRYLKRSRPLRLEN